MLPMNKICEDIKEFIKRIDSQERIDIEKNGAKSYYDNQRKNELILFANKLSESYGEHVDIKLVKSLIVNILNSIKKDETGEI